MPAGLQGQDTAAEVWKPNTTDQEQKESNHCLLFGTSAEDHVDGHLISTAQKPLLALAQAAHLALAVLGQCDLLAVHVSHKVIG